MKKSKIILLCLTSIVLILSTIMVYSYSLWSSTHTQDTSNTVNTGCFELTFTESSNISLLNTYPISDTKGLKTTPYTFTLTNTCTLASSAIISIETLNSTTLDNSYIKVSFQKDNESISTPIIINTLDTTSLIDKTNGLTNYILKTNLISPNDTVSYKIWMWLDESAGNDTQGKILNAKVHVTEQAIDLNLANKLIMDEGGTEAIKDKVAPDLTKAAIGQAYYDTLPDTCTEQYCISKANSTVETGMYSAPDDYGTSYYFRGDVLNNNLIFGGYCWKVVRINGNGSIRVLYNGTPTDGVCINSNISTVSASNISIGTSAFNSVATDNAYVGYMYGTPGSTTYEETHANTNDSTIKTFIDDWYKNNLLDYTDQISDTLFCNDRSISSGTGIGTTRTNYRGFANKTGNINNVTLLCNNQHDRFTVNETEIGNGDLIYSIALLTYDEAVYAGIPRSLYIKNINNNFLFHMDYLTMTPSIGCWTGSSLIMSLTYIGFDNTGATNNFYVRPVINLNSDVIYTQGDGTYTNPYVIKS